MKLRSLWKKSGLVILGGICQGFGMGLFLFPNSIPSGGAGGIAVLLNHWFSMNVGFALWIVNFTLMMIGLNYLGKRFTMWTLVSISVTSIAIDFFESFLQVPDRNIFLDLIIGSFFLGMGIGILMRNNVSNGGSGVIAVMISHKRNILPGKPLFYINMLIFVFTSIVISLHIIVLALISQWISTRIVNFVCDFELQRPYQLALRKKR
ncbi:YitT family protein [Gracilibacillus oryzae]|uniref:YitT family protein n=1 Tax=Gracilibacillus oryzae TaxID=1672701 RepID=A0A7C8GUA9_9BACI|nr:YitT family protein [Gracilibacillus oryzae]KAB8138297.1 YitT family protein [Gracilibacillus oryzae]